MYGYYYDSSYLIFMILSFLVSTYAHFKVQHAFNKYSNIRCSKGISGAEAARKVLDYNEVSGITVDRTKGYFTDYFDSRSKKIYLSDDVYSKVTIASISVAAHESGHATQYSQNYLPLKLRHLLVPVTQIGSNLAMPFIILGLMIPSWGIFVNIGIILFSFAVIFQLVTLPVEFDASRRALETIKATNMLDSSEIEGAKVVLKAAAFTYIAATFTALLSLLRLIWMSRNRRN